MKNLLFFVLLFAVVGCNKVQNEFIEPHTVSINAYKNHPNGIDSVGIGKIATSLSTNQRFLDAVDSFPTIDLSNYNFRNVDILYFSDSLIGYSINASNGDSLVYALTYDNSNFRILAFRDIDIDSTGTGDFTIVRSSGCGGTYSYNEKSFTDVTYFDEFADSYEICHDPNGTFNECFKQHWDDFCDGFAGCLFQATHPVLVALLIAAHCEATTQQIYVFSNP